MSMRQRHLRLDADREFELLGGRIELAMLQEDRSQQSDRFEMSWLSRKNHAVDLFGIRPLTTPMIIYCLRQIGLQYLRVRRRRRTPFHGLAPFARRGLLNVSIFATARCSLLQRSRRSPVTWSIVRLQSPHSICR